MILSAVTPESASESGGGGFLDKLIQSFTQTSSQSSTQSSSQNVTVNIPQATGEQAGALPKWALPVGIGAATIIALVALLSLRR